MQVLEARFYPASRSRPGPAIPIARIYCDGTFVVVEPVAAGSQPMAALDPTAPLEKLHYLVERIGPDTYNRLRALHSDYWSFDALSHEV